MPASLQTGRSAASPPTREFDPSLLAGLRAHVSADEFRDMLCSFLDESTGRLARIGQFSTARSLAEVAAEAHALVSCGTYGFVRLPQFARELERACKAGNVDAVPAIIATLNASAAKGFDELRARFLA
jgi:HPt (histidine-containing phosphotransfer) domain-containing protein